MYNERARSLFGAACPRDLGRPFQDLEFSYRPVELRSLIERRPGAAPSRRAAGGAMGRPRADDAVRRHARRRRCRRARGASLGVSVSFVDVSRVQELQRAAVPVEAGSRDRVRRAAVDQRGAGDDQRGAAVDGRGAGDDERRAAVDQRRAGDDERGAAVDQRGAADDERGAARAQRRAQPRRTAFSSRSCAACAAASSSSTGSCT